VRAKRNEQAACWSNPITVRTAKVFDKVTGLHSTAKTATSITLSWDEIPGAQSHTVMVNGQSYETTANTHVLNDLSVGTLYFISVKAQVTDGPNLISIGSDTITEKLYTLAPQTDYARTFIEKCEGQTWFIDEMEKLLNLKGKSVNTIASRDDLSTIYAIGLADRGLTGTIPPAIGELSNLKYLYLANNRLEGELPDEYYSLTNLIEADLSGNNLTE
jgi:Leucine-rich repeat (LRR) protein